MEENIIEERSLLAGIEDEVEVEETQDQDIVVLEHGKQKFERPEGIPDHFWNEEEGAYKADEILKAYKEEQQKALSLRQKLSKGFHNVPQSPENYTLAEDDIEVNEEELDKFREIAHKNGLTQEQFNSLILDLHDTYGNDEGDSNYNFQLSEEQAQRILNEEMEKLGPNGTQVLTNIRSWGRSLMKQGVISQEHFDTLINMPVSAEQVKVLDILRNISGHIANIPAGIGDPSGLASEEEINMMIASPDYETNPVKQKAVRDYFEKKYR